MLRSCVVVLLVVGLAIPVEVRADVISTSDALALEDAARARVIVDEYLAREAVVSKLATLGVDPELARLRAAALSTTELEEMAGRIEDAPAGGDGFLAVLGIVFIVLLVLELVGVIDIFKKV